MKAGWPVEFPKWLERLSHLICVVLRLMRILPSWLMFLADFHFICWTGPQCVNEPQLQLPQLPIGFFMVTDPEAVR
jgi:hypothetical protein